MRRLVLTTHVQRRMLLRSISDTAIQAAIKSGEVIARDRAKGQSALLILGWVGGRPIHLGLYAAQAERLEFWVSTVYSPATAPWQWSSDYRRRVCWCHRHPDDEIEGV